MTLIQPDLDMQAFIRKELNENVNTNESDLQHIKDWLAKQPHLPQFEGELCSILSGMTPRISLNSDRVA